MRGQARQHAGRKTAAKGNSEKGAKRGDEGTERGGTGPWGCDINLLGQVTVSCWKNRKRSA